jgi:U3 small nucleolar RNA-associated protein 25
VRHQYCSIIIYQPPNLEQRQIQNDILSSLSLYNDLFISRTSLDTQSETREAVALHALNHVMKYVSPSLLSFFGTHILRKRRRVLKNNERIAHHAKARPNDPPLEDVQDQGFTRPSVLVLLPFRNSAQAWVRALTVHTPSPDFQVEHRARFEREFGLPEGAVDKLLSAEPGTYPADHVSTFAGNVDDSFRIGVKMTRKSVKLFSEFYGSDIIIASPLGLRMSMEKEK